MQRTSWKPVQERTSQVARIIAGIILFVLVTGIWACLWVPPWPGF